MARIHRREFLKVSMVGAGALAFGPAFWRSALAAEPAQPAPGPYGPLQPPDANGIMLPEGFRSRIVAQGGVPVPGTNYPWHIFSDGQATFGTEDGGFILVSNSETPLDIVPEMPPRIGPGGASAIRFRADGSIADAYRILSGTSVNCAGGGTPWGTWLSCEEHELGQVWECDPTGRRPAVARPAMGVFEHEAVTVDPAGQRIYLSEDRATGGFYRFTPDRYPDLSAGVLEVAKVGSDGAVTWIPVPDPSAAGTPTRDQVEGMTRFNRSEGIWFDSGIVYLATTNDSKIHMYDTVAGRMEVLYDAATIENPPLTNVDNITVSQSGDLFVCEDTTNSDDPGLDIGLITPDREVSRFLKVTGTRHGVASEARSELCGVVFDPSGTRMFFSSQRALVTGIIYEITGPFRLERPASARQASPSVRVPRRITTGALIANGVPVSVVAADGVAVTARFKARLASARSSTAAARVVTVGRRRRSADSRGRASLRLRPRSALRARLRRRTFRGRVTVILTDQLGRRTVIRRSVLVAPTFRRR